MGYSNNKWRKILTILMIVNLCFILFSKISRVFAVTPTTFFNEEVIQINPIEITNNLSLTPINFLFSSDYDMYTILVKTLPNDTAYEGYAIIVHKGDTLKIQYSDKKNGLNRAYPTLVFSASNKVCTIPFNVRLDSNLQNVYNNRMNEFSTSNLWWNNIDERSFSAWSFSDFSSSFPNNIIFSSNSYLDFYNTSNEKIDDYSPFIAPSFDDPTEIENGNPDGVYITPGDYSSNDNLYFHLLQIDTGLSNSDASIYYYSDKTFVLNKDSEYFRTWVDPNIEGYYYYVPRYKLGLSQNTSYLYVLNNSKEQIQNSQGIYAKDVSNGIYDVIQSDTAGVITATEEETDRMKNIEQSLVQNQETTNSINDTLTNTTVPEETETDIDSSLNFSNSAPQFSSLFNGYFSRLTSIISDLGNYQDTDVITISIPIPFTNDTIPISSNFIFSNQNNNFLRNIATLLWYFIFGRYFLYFLINTYWLITNGQFFDNYLTQKEAITGDML